MRLPIGFVYDGTGHVRLDPDARVQDIVRRLFRTFAYTMSISGRQRALTEFLRTTGQYLTLVRMPGAGRGLTRRGMGRRDDRSSVLHAFSRSCVRRNWDQTRDRTLSHLGPNEQKVAKIEQKWAAGRCLAEESQLFGSHGGDDDADNLALACPDCNLRKGPNLTGIDPQSGEVVRLFHPRRDRWFDHFGYEEQYVVGTTSVGRTSVSLLEMNDPERRRIRELIAQIQN
jgi:HNH endonuclease